MTEQTGLKKFTYQLDHDDPAPTPGQHIVTIGKRGILSVMLIRHVRRINHKTVKDYQGYRLEALNQPDLKPYTEFEIHRSGHLDVWVRGEPALPCVWVPRRK